MGEWQKKLAYFTPTIFAALLFTVLSAVSAPPVAGKIVAAAPAPVSGFTVSIKGNELGWVFSKESFFLMKDTLDPGLAWFFRDDFVKRNLAFTAAEMRNTEAAAAKTKKTVVKYIESHRKGWGITVNGKTIIALPSKEACGEVLDKVIESYEPMAGDKESIKDLEVTLLEKPQTHPDIFPSDEILDTDDAVTFLLKGTLETKTYEVVENDTVWSISRAHGLTMEEIARANPSINPDRIYPGDELDLIVPKPFLTVEMRYIHEYIRNIQYHTYVKWDPTLYRTESVIERHGHFGEERVIAEVRTENGTLSDKKIVDSYRLSQPISAIIRRGTARTPNDVLVASAFLPDGMGIITSYYGPRWGRFHAGIDVAVPIGTPVYAYQGGTVAYAGYSSLLGKVVAIKQQDGMLVKYGHNSTLLVRNGDLVKEGQIISLSGNSGFSTGPHVHFEVKKNGVSINPLGYLKRMEEKESDDQE